MLPVVRLKYPVELEAEELPDVDVKLETVELVELEVEVPVGELLELAEVEVSVVELEDEVLETPEAVVEVFVEMLVEIVFEVLVEVLVEVGRVALLQLHSSKYPFMRSAYDVPFIGLFSESVASKTMTPPNCSGYLHL